MTATTEGKKTRGQRNTPAPQPAASATERHLTQLRALMKKAEALADAVVGMPDCGDPAARLVAFAFPPFKEVADQIGDLTCAHDCPADDVLDQLHDISSLLRGAGAIDDNAARKAAIGSALTTVEEAIALLDNPSLWPSGTLRRPPSETPARDAQATSDDAPNLQPVNGWGSSMEIAGGSECEAVVVNPNSTVEHLLAWGLAQLDQTLVLLRIIGCSEHDEGMVDPAELSGAMRHQIEQARVVIAAGLDRIPESSAQ